MLMKLLVLLLSVGEVTAQNPRARESDLDVYQAVLTSTIRPEIQRMRGKPDGQIVPVLTLDRTVAMCRADVIPMRPLGCVREEYIEAVTTESRPGQGLLFKERLSPTVREELAKAFRERNRESQRFSGDQIDGFIVVTPDNYQRELESRQIGTVRFSAPAYSRDGHALVYGSYVCGGLCGEGWLFLLERRGDSWRVVSTEGVWIS